MLFTTRVSWFLIRGELTNVSDPTLQKNAESDPTLRENYDRIQNRNTAEKYNFLKCLSAILTQLYIVELCFGIRYICILPAILIVQMPSSPLKCFSLLLLAVSSL